MLCGPCLNARSGSPLRQVPAPLRVRGLLDVLGLVADLAERRRARRSASLAWCSSVTRSPVEPGQPGGQYDHSHPRVPFWK